MGMIYLGRLNETDLAAKGALLPSSQVKALEEAERILQVAREEAELVKRQAYDEGIAEGIAKGQEEIATMLADVQLQFTQHLKDLEPVLVDCIIQSVRSLLGELESHRLIERAVLQVRDYLADVSGLVVRVAPETVSDAEQAISNLVNHHGIDFPMRIVADQCLGSDDCVLESPLGRAEVKSESVFARIRDAIEKALANRKPS